MDDVFEIVVHQLDTSIDMMYLGANTVMCTPFNFLRSKVRFIHANTVTRSHSCSGKSTSTPRVHLVAAGIGVIGGLFWHTPKSQLSKSDKEIQRYGKD